MLNRLLPFTILTLMACAAWGQTPQSITLEHGGQLGGQPDAFMACQDQFAGTISFSNFIGQSNDIDLDTIFFCFGDQIDIVHNGDQDLTGDPNPFTVPGITYGYFDCPPTISGPNLTTILTDPCITNNPLPANGIHVTSGGNFNGNYTFQNMGISQNNFNGGDPVVLWFAPLTVDNFASKAYENDPISGESGPCVNLNVDEAFAVAYLNEIEISNFGTINGSSGCGGAFEVSGGLPELDGSDYTDITITLVGNPSVTGTVTSNPVGHGGTIEFEVPTPGFYNITVEDGKSCAGTLIANMSSCISVTQSNQSLSAAPGDQVCINVTHENGFTDIVSMQYGISWDPAVLSFSSIENLTPNIPNFTVPTSFNVVGDTMIFAWASFAGTGITLPPGEVVYQICFDVIGQDGDCSEIEYITPAGSTIEVVNENGAILGFNGIDGEICVSNSALIVDFVQDSVTCSGGNDGSFTTTVSGGMPPYNISWQSTSGGPIGGPLTLNVDGGSATTPANLEAGTYSVTITDVNMLTVIENMEVLGPPVLAVNLSANPGPCNGDLGSVASTLILDTNIVASPLIDYDYLWSTGDMGTSITNLLAGPYSLTVTETSTGCSIENTVTLPNPSALSMVVTYDTASCSGVSDGTIMVVVSGGSPDANGDYTIEMPTAGIGVTITGTMANVSGIATGDYPITITDGNGCTLEDVLFLPAKKILSIDADITLIACDQACSGGIFITGQTDGVGGVTPAIPYNFDWFGSPPPAPPVFETATQSSLANLCEGTYWVVMEDTEGCEIVDTFYMTEPDPLILSLINTEDESCDPGDDGSITIGVSDGEYPYTYAWNASPSTDSIATGLSAGLYTVTVEDNNGCSDTISATISAPTPPEILVLDDFTLDCPGDMNGELSVTATGPVNINAYEWSNGDLGQNIFGLGAGQYIVTVTDDNGCTDVDTALVFAPEPVILDTVTLTQPQCPGDGNGIISPTYSGGSGTLSFIWSTGFMGQTISGLTAGEYTVTVSDGNCPGLVDTFTLEDPPSIIVNFSDIDSVSCASGSLCDGGATATALYSDGSTGFFDFDWLFNGVADYDDEDVISSTFNALCVGSNVLLVSDGICNDTLEVDIPSPPQLSSESEVENVTCFGDTDGTAEIMAGGGTAPYSIVWPNGSTDFFIENLAPGEYNATITDFNGCPYTHLVTIGEPDQLTLSLNGGETFNVSCNGYEDGVITVVAAGGNNINGPGTQYVWGNNVPSNTSVATGLTAGTYSVTVVDVKGCSADFTHIVTEPSRIEFRLADYEEILCFGDRTFLTVDSVWGGAPSIYQFSVDGSPGIPIGAEYGTFAGEILVEVFDVQSTDCLVDTTIVLSEPAELMIELPDVIEIELGDTTTQLLPQFVPNIPIDSFLWEPAEGLSCSDCKNPIVNVTGNQTFTLTIWDINGCTATQSIFIDIDRNRNVFIPNIFSPTGDGINDRFQVFTGQGVERINFVRVYDRWGELVFEEPSAPLAPSLDGTPGWDGRLDGEKMNPAVFLYLVEVEFVDGQVLLYRGDVTLIR